MQATLKKTVRLDGVGLHSGAPARLEMHPAPAGHGIVFRRVDLATARDIPARWDNVIPSKLCTLLEGEGGVTLSTVEHVMAALVGTGIQNLLIEVDGPEVPILDGSAAPFVRAILRAGIALQNTPLRAIRVLRPVEVREGEAFARLSPADHLEIEFQIDFTDAAIGRQEKRLDMANGAFLRELADSRTFCRQSDVEAMRRNGLAR
ncbi:MAG TPA: UDP-3-O-[3-hydroxymyristoyl] N-acetylglucosamine deacetylase, partial [Paracoccus sp.]|nr:UDP-3-O-[3-hydroxymyristoyl] N-acetylglucosamine deacetylase [Paracoccus sp. (in: a-proteobacteria)]